jgi:prepilin-type N-terminal cleavage/methylation domain-containing protein
MKERGLTLVETLVALALVGVAIGAILPAFTTQLGSNTRNEVRSEAVAAAEILLEELRGVDLGTLPTSGQSAPRLVQVGQRTYDVTVFYCETAAYCDPYSRHLRVEVQANGRKVFDAESVYTQFN